MHGSMIVGGDIGIAVLAIVGLQWLCQYGNVATQSKIETLAKNAIQSQSRLSSYHDLNFLRS